MNRNWLLLSLAALLTLFLVFRGGVPKKRESESKPVRNSTFDHFELSINKTFNNESVIDGEKELVSKVRDYEKSLSERADLEAELSEMLLSGAVSSGERYAEGQLVRTVNNRPGWSLSENIFLNEGLNYQYSSRLTVGVKFENVLGWFSSDDEENLSFLSSLSSNNESSVLFTLRYTF